MEKFDYFEFEAGHTSSGIPVFAKKLPWCNGWALAQAILKFGHWDIPEGKEGLAHLLEHLLFLGTEKYPSKEIINEQADRTIFLGTLGGAAGWERLWLSGKLVTQNFTRGVDVLKELLFFPILRETDLAREKEVVLAEMWENYTCQANIESRRIMRLDFYTGHTMRRNADIALGDEETIGHISLRDITDTHKKYFHTGNLFFLFAGDMSLRTAISLAELATADIPCNPSRQPRQKPEHWPGPSLPIREISSRELMGGEFSGRTKVRISMFRMLPKNTNPYFNEVIRDIYHRLLDEKFRHEMQITYGVRASIRTQSDYDELEIWLEVDPGKYEPTRSLMEKMITQFGTRKSDEHLFHKVIADGMNRSRILEFLAGNILDISMVEFINYGKIYSTREMHEFKRAITFPEITDCIGRELSANKLYWCVLMP